MKLTPAVLLLLFFNLIQVSSFAQSDFKPGYILNLQNDTIQGLIKHQGKLSSKSKCVFKASETAKAVTYASEQLKGYGFRNGEKFVSSLSVGYKVETPVFLEHLIGGKINLYFYRTREKQGDYYVAIKDTAVVELNNALDTVYHANSGMKIKGYRNLHRYRVQLLSLMADKPELHAQIAKTDYALASLTDLVLKYNGQTQASQMTHGEDTEEGIKAHRFRFGVAASTGALQLYLSEIAYQNGHQQIRFVDFNDNYYYSIGALINVQLREVHPKLSFQAEPSIAVIHYGSDVTRGSGSSYESRNVLDFDITAVKLPISVKYAFYASRQKFNPTLRLGVSQQRFLRKTAKMNYTVSEPSTSSSGSYSDFAYANYQNSVFVAAGGEFRLKKNALQAEVILEGGDGIYVIKYDPALAHSWTRSLLFQVAYIFN